MRIGIGTESSIKVRALEQAVHSLGIDADIVPVKTPTNVSEQPYGYEDAVKGARNRMEHVLARESVDVAVGLESSLVYVESLGQWFDVAVVVAKTQLGHSGYAISTGYAVPAYMIKKVQETGVELGVIVQELADGGEKDTLKYISGGRLKREDALRVAMQSALIQALYPEKYNSE